MRSVSGVLGLLCDEKLRASEEKESILASEAGAADEHGTGNTRTVDVPGVSPVNKCAYGQVRDRGRASSASIRRLTRQRVTTVSPRRRAPISSSVSWAWGQMARA